MEILSGLRVLDVDLEFDLLAEGQVVEDAGDAARDAGAHQHVGDPGEHRAVERRQGGQLDLFEEIDADRAVVSLAGEEDFDEIRQHC